MVASSTVRIGDRDFTTNFAETNPVYADSQAWLRRYMGTLKAEVQDKPGYVSALSRLYPKASPDVLAAIAANNGDIGSPAVREAIRLDMEAQSAQEPPNPPLDDWTDAPVASQLKGVTRFGMEALTAPLERVGLGLGFVSTVGADLRDAYFGDGTGVDVNYLEYLADLANPIGGTSLGAVAEQAWRDKRFDTGDSWFGIDEESAAGHVERQSAYQRARIRMVAGLDNPLGDKYEAMTVGGSVAFFNTGKFARDPIYDNLSGLVDAYVSLVFDPVNLVGVGPFSKAAKVAKLAAAGDDLSRAGAGISATQKARGAAAASSRADEILLHSENVREEFREAARVFVYNMANQVMTRSEAAQALRNERIASEASREGARYAQNAARARAEKALKETEARNADGLATEAEKVAARFAEDTARYTPAPASAVPEQQVPAGVMPDRVDAPAPATPGVPAAKSILDDIDIEDYRAAQEAYGAIATPPTNRLFLQDNAGNPTFEVTYTATNKRAGTVRIGEDEYGFTVTGRSGEYAIEARDASGEVISSGSIGGKTFSDKDIADSVVTELNLRTDKATRETPEAQEKQSQWMAMQRSGERIIRQIKERLFEIETQDLDLERELFSIKESVNAAMMRRSTPATAVDDIFTRVRELESKIAQKAADDAARADEAAEALYAQWETLPNANEYAPSFDWNTSGAADNPFVQITGNGDETIPTLRTVLKDENGNLFVTDRYRALWIPKEMKGIKEGDTLFPVRAKSSRDATRERIKNATGDEVVYSKGTTVTVKQAKAMLDAEEKAAAAKSKFFAFKAIRAGEAPKVLSLVKSAGSETVFDPTKARLVEAPGYGRGQRPATLITDGTIAFNPKFIKQVPKGATIKYGDPNKPALIYNESGEIIGLQMPVRVSEGLPQPRPAGAAQAATPVPIQPVPAAQGSVTVRTVTNRDGSEVHEIVHTRTGVVIDTVRSGADDAADRAAVLEEAARRADELGRMPAYADDAETVEDLAAATARMDADGRRLAQFAAEAGMGEVHDYGKVTALLRRKAETAKRRAAKADAKAQRAGELGDARAVKIAAEQAAKREQEFQAAKRELDAWIASIRVRVSRFVTDLKAEVTKASELLGAQADEATQEANRLLAQARQLASFALNKNLDEVTDPAALARLGDEPTAEDFLNALIAETGGGQGFLGDAVGALDRILGSTNRQRLMFLVANMKSPQQISRLFRGRLRAQVAVALADVKTPDEVAAVLAVAYSEGNVALDSIAKLRGVLPRTMLTRLIGAGRTAEAPRFTSPFAKALDESVYGLVDEVKADRILSQSRPGSRLVPWAYRINGHDATSVATATSDWIVYSLPGKKFKKVRDELAREYGDRILRAETIEERWNAFQGAIRAVRQTVVDTAKLRGKDGQKLDELVERLEKLTSTHTSQVTKTREYAAQILSEGGGKVKIGDAGELDVNEVANAIYQLTDEFALPMDPRALRRVARSLSSRESTPEKIIDGFRNIVDGVFDRTWRAWVLLRVAFMLRNVIDVQIRAYLSGYYTTPWEALAMTLASHGYIPPGRMGRLIDDLAWGNKNLLGGDWTKFSELDEMSTAVRNAAYNSGLGGSARSMMDPGVYRAGGKAGGSAVRFASPDGSKAWAQEIIRAATDPIQGEMLRIRLGVPSKRLAAMAEKEGISIEEALLRSVADPESPIGEESMRLVTAWRLRARDEQASIAEKTRKAELRGRTYTPTEAEESMTRLVAEFDKDPVRAWGDLIAGAYQQKLDTLLLGDSQDIIDTILKTGILDGRAPSSKSGTVRSLSASARRTRDRLKEAGMDEMIDFDLYYVPTDGEAPGKLRGFDAMFDVFFRGSGYIEKSMGQHPLFVRAYAEQIEKYAGNLRADDVDEFLQLFRTFLGVDKRASVNPVSRGRRQALYDRVESKVRSGERGTWSLDRLHKKASFGAEDITKDIFYNAANRSQAAASLMLVFPFGQAFANTIRVYLQQAAKNPLRAYVAAKVYESLTKEGSGEFLDLIGVDRQEGQGIIFADERGKMMARVPWLGTIAGPGVSVTTAIDSWNLATGGGLPLPGAGPIPRVAYAVARDSTPWFWLPQFARDGIVRYFDPSDTTNTSNILERTAPASLRQFVFGFLMNGENVVQQYRQQAYMIELNSGGWTVNDGNGNPVVPPEKMQEFANAVDSRARKMAGYHGILKNAFPGSTGFELYTKTDDGEFVTQSMMYAEMNELSNYLGDPSLAYQVMADKYGPGNLAIIIGDTENSRPGSHQAWKFARENEDVAIRNIDAFGYFFPGQEGSAALRLFYQGNDRNQKLSAEDWVKKWNNTQYSMIKSTLEVKVAAGIITDDAAKQAMDEFSEATGVKYEWGVGGASLESRIDAITRASQEPALDEAPAAASIKRYLQMRQAALAKVEEMGFKSFEAKAVAGVRDVLLRAGEELVQSDPSFTLVWDRVFKNELEG